MSEHNPVLRGRVNVIAELAWLELICCGQVLRVFEADEKNDEHAEVSASGLAALVRLHEEGKLEGRPVPPHYPERLRS